MVNPVVLLLVGVGFVVSLAAAHAAGGGARSAWAWGLFGPVGWIVAALLGVQRRVDAVEAAIGRLAVEPRRAAALSPAAGPTRCCPACHSANTDPLGPGRVVCRKCGATSTFDE